MPQEKLTIAEKFFVVPLALVLAVTVFGFGLLAALSQTALSYNMDSTHLLPEAVVPGASIADITLLNNASEGDTLKLVALDTRNYVMGRSVSLPHDKNDMRGYSESVMSHLRDVRSVIVITLWSINGAVLLMLLALIVCIARRRMRMFFTACLSAGIGMIVMFAAFGCAIYVNFSGLFESFHRIFFAEGSWQFAADSLLIRAFPLQFWMQEALVWAGFSILVAIIYLILGVAGRKRVATAGFSVN